MSWLFVLDLSIWETPNTDILLLACYPPDILFQYLCCELTLLHFLSSSAYRLRNRGWYIVYGYLS